MIAASQLPVVFVDFKKAFDSVLHFHLLEKLHRQFGINGQLYAWMKHYLLDQKQFTGINGKESFFENAS